MGRWSPWGRTSLFNTAGVRPPQLFAAGLAFALVVVAPLADASWFQAGGDAARTGVIAVPGPEFGDVAFVAQLPGSVVGSLAIDDGWIYAVSSDYGHPGGRAAAWRVELATGQVEHLFDLPEEALQYGSPSFDGERLFLFDGRDVIGWSLDTGQEIGRWTPPLAVDEGFTRCTEPTFDGGALFFACAASPIPNRHPVEIVAAGSTNAAGGTTNMAVASLDPTNLEVNWEREPEIAEGATCDNEQEGGVSAGGVPVFVALSVGADRVFLNTVAGWHLTFREVPVVEEPLPVQPVANHNEFMVWALDVTEGVVQWNVCGESSTGVRAEDYPPISDLRSPDAIMAEVVPLVGPDALYVTMDAVLALNLATGATMWREEVGQADSLDIPGGSGFGLFDDALLATSIQTAYRMDAAWGVPVWENRLPPGSSYVYVGAPVAVDGERAYFQTIGCEGGESRIQMGGFRAIDLASGHLVWESQETEPYPDLPYLCWSPGASAHGEGIIARGYWDGRLIVLGQTEASLRLPDLPLTAYPAVGETVTVDLSGTRAGIDGPATRFMADWGDGTVTEWQAEPRLTHTYNESGEKRVRLVAANVNQTSTALVTYDVGGTPPREPNLIATIFAPENQDLTFGILGILVALTGGFIALAARRRKRGILQRELEAIERAYQSTRADPVACDAALVERQAHCRGLLLDGRIDESQFAVFKERIEDLARGLRLSTLDERFHFLPHGMVLAMRDMLTDGRISAWERDHILQALDDDTVLTRSQKTKVRRLVDGWFEKDAATKVRAG